MTVPVETMHAASLHESYQSDLVQPVNDDHDFLRKCVNNGIPVRTSTAIDQAVYAVLQQAGVEYDSDKEHIHDIDTATYAYRAEVNRGPMANEHEPIVRCLHVDTMANATFLTPDLSPYMIDKTACTVKIQVANSQSMSAQSQGTWPAWVLNVDEHAHVPLVQPFTPHGIVPPELSRSLLSVDSLYRQGYSPLFRHPSYECGTPELYKPPDANGPAVRIPMSYDWFGSGGFRIFYVPAKSASESYAEVLRRHMVDESVHRGSESCVAWQASLMHACDANAVGRKIADHPMVEEIIHSPDSPSPCNELLTHPKVHRRDKLSVVYAQHSQDRTT